MIIDVLLQMPREAQHALLRRAAEAARERLIVRLFDPQRGWRSLVGWLSDGGIWLAGLYRRASVAPLPLATHPGDAGGARASPLPSSPAGVIMPLPNVLVVARRRKPVQP